MGGSKGGRTLPEGKSGRGRQRRERGEVLALIPLQAAEVLPEETRCGLAHSEGDLEGSGKGTLCVNQTYLRGKAAQELLV